MVIADYIKRKIWKRCMKKKGVVIAHNVDVANADIGSGILRAYNSLLIQPNPTFGAELNYYKSFRSAYDRAFEAGDYAKQTEAIGGAFDVNAALREAIAFETENSFQTYMD